MSIDAMPVPFWHRIFYIIDFLICSLYIYITTYLIIKEGSSIFLEYKLEQIDFFLVAGIAFFGWIGNFKMVRGRINGLFFCYIAWFLGVAFLAFGFFYVGVVFPILPKAIPSDIVSQEWFSGDFFYKILSIRAGFLGLYFAILAKTTSIYSYFNRIQKEQIEKDRSGSSVGSFRSVKQLDIPSSSGPVFHQDTTQNDIPAKKPVFNKKRGFFRKLFSAFMILFFLSMATGIATYFFSPETYEKVYKQVETYLPVIKNTIENFLKKFSNSPIEQYKLLLQNKIILDFSPGKRGKSITVSDAVEEICFLTKVPYINRKIEGSEKTIAALLSYDAKASDFLKEFLLSQKLQYDLCPKGLYLKTENETISDWSSFNPTQRTSQFLPSSKK